MGDRDDDDAEHRPARGEPEDDERGGYRPDQGEEPEDHGLPHVPHRRDAEQAALQLLSCYAP